MKIRIRESIRTTVHSLNPDTLEDSYEFRVLRAGDIIEVELGEEVGDDEDIFYLGNDSCFILPDYLWGFAEVPPELAANFTC